MGHRPHGFHSSAISTSRSADVDRTRTAADPRAGAGTSWGFAWTQCQVTMARCIMRCTTPIPAHDAVPGHCTIRRTYFTVSLDAGITITLARSRLWVHSEVNTLMNGPWSGKRDMALTPKGHNAGIITLYVSGLCRTAALLSNTPPVTGPQGRQPSRVRWQAGRPADQPATYCSGDR